MHIGHSIWSKSSPRTITAAARLTAFGFTVLACCLASQAQEQATPPAATTEAQESARAVQMRQFLGLGRAPDAKVAAEGAKLFGPTCGFCHGANARGGVGPDLLRSSVVLDDNQGEVLGPVIRKGFPDNGMPAFPGLTDEQVREIAEFLHEQVYLAANRGTYQIQNIVTGDAARWRGLLQRRRQVQHLPLGLRRSRSHRLEVKTPRCPERSSLPRVRRITSPSASDRDFEGRHCDHWNPEIP